ncbi:metal-binding protein [Muricauda sp. 40Bstr401]|uniref:Metal-binding protein n=2 Tax=Flagellimonas sediminis TaxID=2696468 RepID=A0A6I5KVQ4_9FLAO|nr:metal-binding protein [Allomuricauda sediminis]
MMEHENLTDLEVRQGIKTGIIQYGGNRKLKIYGTLKCKSGKRMKRENRVFFGTEREAIAMGYRPCGHCSQELFKKWKDGFVQQ